MIFSYLIEGVPSWKLVLEGRKTQTRRLGHRYAVGKVIAVQPGRGQKAVGHIRITRCWHQTETELTDGEAIKEGFIPHNVLLPGVDANLCQVVGATPRERFIELWGQRYPWADYPYDWWAYEFEVVMAWPMDSTEKRQMEGLLMLDDLAEMERRRKDFADAEAKIKAPWETLGVDGVEEEDDD